ncbi:hypothetical protein NMBB_0741 [Neisseria meningitidis alpha710]|nr:hypothetical protein NMBB_0741 [Neisseria meningitidis alpha710]
MYCLRLRRLVLIFVNPLYKRKQIGGRPGKPAPNASGKYAYRWKTQPHPPPGVSDGTAAARNVRRLRHRRTQKTVCLHLQQSDRYRCFFQTVCKFHPSAA